MPVPPLPKAYYIMNYKLTGGAARQQVGELITFLCDVNADAALLAPSAFNLLCPAVSKASTC